MLDQIAQSIQQQDYKTAARLLKPLLKTDLHNPWVRFYAARVQEGLGKRDAAERIYLQLLPNTTNPKLMAQIRQGIARIEASYQENRQNDIENAIATPGGKNFALLILEPITTNNPKETAKAFGKIMNLDPYTARLQLPKNGWRFYRTGKLGELNYYVSTLAKIKIPSFCFVLDKIEKLQVFNVDYIQANEQTVKVRCTNADGQQGGFTFNWSDVTQQVQGRLPFFESVVTVDAKHQLTRKTQKQDDIPFCDLHIPQKRAILRFNERNYQFTQGITLNLPSSTSQDLNTDSKNWTHLLNLFNRHLPHIPLWSDFNHFADSVLDFRDLLGGIESHIDLDRRTPSLWDPAFQLYSVLVFWRNHPLL